MFISSFIQYLKFEKRFSPHTIKSYQGDLDQFNNYIEKEFERKISEAGHIEIRGWLVTLVNKGISNKSINRKLSSLKTFFKFLLKKEIIAIDPTLKVIAPKISKKLPVFVEAKAMSDLFEEEFPDNFEGTRDKLIFDILYSTGIRVSELVGLRVTDFDKNALTIKVLGKGNKERIIPVNERLSQETGHYLAIRQGEFEEADWQYLLLTGKGKKMYPKFVYNIVRKYLSKVTTLDRKSPHILRHTFATHLLNNGADLNAIKELLGHANLSATQVYTHNTIERLKTIYKQSHPKA